MNTNKKQITSQKEDFSKWYLDIIDVADLAENSLVRGCMVIKPYGYAIWENIQKELDTKIKDTGHKNAYFPLFVPKSTLGKETEHVEGFAKECAIVTHYRLKLEKGKLIVDPEAKLEEELIIRPTSEAIIYETFSKWISSYRDLPLLINQWANVVRWEMRTRPFLRTTEFLWQEGHTAHATCEQADDEALKMLYEYKDLVEKYLAIPVIVGQKSEAEKFPGAFKTYTLEALMQDGKALQSATSHNLGQGFAKAFDIQFTDKDGTQKYVWQTSWGMSTRIIGALIMMHSDNKGLVLPPKIAPIQVIIIPVLKGNKEDNLLLEKSYEIADKLKMVGVRVEIDDKDYKSLGFKFNEWEAKGVPLRIELGNDELINKNLTLVRRDTGEKLNIDLNDLIEKIQLLQEDIQTSIYNKAKEFIVDNTFEVSDYKDFKNKVDKGGFIKAFWCENTECEKSIKEETKVTTRCLPLDSKKEAGKCVHCGNDSVNKWLFAQSY